ncbi:MAG: hypothetical protein ABIA04_07825 [Pseudomonadota bacterium]
MDSKLFIPTKKLDEVNLLFKDEKNPILCKLQALVDKYGGPEKINSDALNASKLEVRLEKLREMNSPYLKDLEWLINEREKSSFISMKAYLEKHNQGPMINENPVTLEISALQYFPWIISQAKKAIANNELMPGRFIRVRNMKEQENDLGDLIATHAAVSVVGASIVETLDTKGVDGSNVHLGGPATITGYFGGPGQPNHYPLKWADEFLYYYTNYGVQQVLNINPGTVLLGYMLHKLGVDIEFKISVFMGNDNPFSVLWTLLTAKLFSREDGTTPLIGFNFSNSVNNETIELSSYLRKLLVFEDNIRFEHHITETQKSIVRQPYDRTAELLEIAKIVPNISAKHEGGIVEIDSEREHPSDILDYFRTKEDIISSNEMGKLELNYLDKHDALNRSARELIKSGTPVIAAWNLHK